MNKNTIIGLIAVIIIIILCLGGYFLLTNQNENNNVNNLSNNPSNDPITNEEEDQNDNNQISTSNVLVVYFSAQGHTEEVAGKIAENLDATLFAIEPADPYTDDDLNWTDDNSRVSREHDDESLRDVELTTTTVPNWDSYDTVIIGYPIWWGIAAWPVDSFVKVNDFSGKTVIPFCTSASSSLGQSGNLLAETAGTGNWLEGHRFSSNPTDSEIDEWTTSLN